MQGATPALVERHRREPVFRPPPEQPLGRLAATKAVVHIADTLAEPPSMRGRLNRLTGARTILNVMEDNAGEDIPLALRCVRRSTSDRRL